MYDLVRPVVLPLHNYDRMAAILEAEKNVTVDRNAWKRREWRLGEDVGWDNWETASLQYFRWAAPKAAVLHACPFVPRGSRSRIGRPATGLCARRVGHFHKIDKVLTN